jgi:superfamily II DNA/RNA helicase
VLPEIVDALAAVGIVHPFPIQSMAIPIALTGTDMIGQARTGTGKTLAFGITVLQRTVVPGERDYDMLAQPGAPQALIVTPTRELASQVSNDLAIAARIRRARVLTVYGGVGYDTQLSSLAEGVDVVVGTPGRLLDLADRGVLDLTHVKVLVLDEADEMLDLGFLPDVERILDVVPELRQTMLFSATMPSAIVTLARRHMRHPVNIRAESPQDATTVPTTAQFVYRAHDLDKPEVVARILQAENRSRVMIFCRTKRSAQRVADDLIERGFAAAPIHGDLSQILREKALKKFRSGGVNVLVATDVAARGIDVEGVTHVINYECPDDDNAYVHRIGRTGRAGASGVAITFVDWADESRWKMINSSLGLPFEEPQETYSTSPHLYHDLGIPTGAQGRMRPAAVEEPAPREKRDRTPRKRARTRLRNGVPVRVTTPDEVAQDQVAQDQVAQDQVAEDGSPVSAPPPAEGTEGGNTPAEGTEGGNTPAEGTEGGNTPAGGTEGGSVLSAGRDGGDAPDQAGPAETAARPRRRRRRRSGSSPAGAEDLGHPDGAAGGADGPTA